MNKTIVTSSTKLVLVGFISTWLLLAVAEWIGLGIFHGHYVYWRGWEKTLNHSGEELSKYPFKPWSTYEGKFVGDLLNVAYLHSSPEEKRNGKVIMDEYGQRNSPGFMDDPIDAVVVGSSFVAGAAFDQEELISEILTHQYGIRTYNYYGTLQTVWDNEIFWDQPPKYIILLGVEGEILSAPWKTAINPNPATKWHPHQWRSYNEWETANDPRSAWTFNRYLETARNYSLTRFASIQLYTTLVNVGRTRDQIMRTSNTKTVKYDLATDTLLYYPSLDDPRYNSEGKTFQDINTAIEQLNQSQGTLKETATRLIVVAIPSKTHLTLQKYRHLSPDETALAIFNQHAATASAFINIDMYQTLINNVRATNHRYYYKDDSHWKPEVNILVSKAIAHTISTHESNN